jgi:hypothetical protein
MACVSQHERGAVGAIGPRLWRRARHAWARFLGFDTDKVADARPWVVLLSRPPVVSRMSGGSVYLLSIAEFLRKSGYRVAFIGVSPDGIGIRPCALIDRKVLEAFDLYRIRGWHPIGRYWLRTDSLFPWIAAPLKLALRKCLPISRRLLPASIEARLNGYSRKVRNLSPASEAEVAFARHFLRFLSPDHIFVYYFCLTNILETPEAVGRHSYVLTHSLFSKRARFYDGTGILSQWSPVSEDVEMGALAKASTIVSIQEAEARTIRRCLPNHHVVTAPLAMSIRRGTKQQLSSRCLFVGAASDHNAARKWLATERP